MSVGIFIGCLACCWVSSRILSCINDRSGGVDSAFWVVLCTAVLTIWYVAVIVMVFSLIHMITDAIWRIALTRRLTEPWSARPHRCRRAQTEA